MAETGFLKTVNFGGFDKKDVLNYVDELNTKIYTLENELEEKKALLESSGGNGVDKEKYEELLSADRAKITELQSANESLNIQIKTTQDEIAAKDAEIEDLKKKLSEMEDELVNAKNKAAAAPADNSAMDLSNVFIEAQRTANTIVTQAKESARKMDEDAKKLANQVVDDANSKASSIVKTADEKASQILTDAKDKTADMEVASGNMKAVLLTEVTEIAANITKIKALFDTISVDTLAKISETSDLLKNTETTLTKGGVPVFKAPASAAQRQPAPQARPQQPAPAQPRPAAPAPAPAQPQAQAQPQVQPAVQTQPGTTPAQPKPQQPKTTPKLAGFDMSEIEKLANAIDNGNKK